MYPVIEYMNITKPFKYIWLRYITGIDFENHCAKTFKGTYSKKVTKEPEQKEIALDERDLTKCRYQFYYLCGVSAPYVHEHNFHLAFIYKEGSTVHYNHNGIEIKIKDACQLRITPQDIDWQFAHTIKCILTNEIADLFGGIPSTFYEWLNTHDSFSEYYKKGWMKK